MQKSIIIGAGGHGRVVLDIIRAAGEYQPIGFIDNNPQLWGKYVDGLKVLGDFSKIEEIAKSDEQIGAIVAIGDCRIRRTFAEMLASANIELINAIHPSANVASTATLGKNIVIAAGAVICAHCQIGNSVILNTGCIVDHESIIANSAHICPGAKLAGRVIVESGAFVGIGATIIQNVRIGTDAVVGAGAVVIKDVPADVTVVGVPAKIVRPKKTEAILKFPPDSDVAEIEDLLVRT